jgi:predicted ATPase/transcriptional regulator with XRE-family HTH domain
VAEESFSFGSLLRHQRLAARLTQEELAARCGLGARTIQNLERGANLPRPETLDRLASLLGLAGEARARFAAAAKPLPPGPRDVGMRISPDERAGIPEIVRLADRRRVEPATSSILSVKRTGNAATSPEPQVPNNLPVQWTSFIGRERALLDVALLLEANHLVTLTGAGGCGKTRLSLEVATRQMEIYPDGVWFIELAPLADPALVGQAIASVLGLRETPDKPIAQTLTEHLQSKQTLLVVDNCEHLIDGAAQIIDVILRACPHARVLATSREALRIPGEVHWRVPSLAVPTAEPTIAVEDVVDVESVRLFVERGRAVRTDFGVTRQNASAVTQICRRLDGIPLAIELAATHVGALPVEQIAARLDQRFSLLTVGSRVALPRHQTLAALIGWSYDRLTGVEQTLFNRLSVFAGGFTLEAAEAVSLESDDALAALSELVRKSLVVADGETGGVERYHLLETLRQYGRERLVTLGEDASSQQRHAAYYLRLAEEARPHLFQPEQLVYLARLDHEWDNVRVAFRWFIDHKEAEAGMRLGTALEFWYWYRVIDEPQWYAWRTQLLALPSMSPPSAARANTLLWASCSTMIRRDLPGARRLFAEALATARQAGDEGMLAWVMHRTSRYGGPAPEKWYGASALDLAKGAVALYQAISDRWGVAITQTWLGYLEYHQGKIKHAHLLLTEALAIARAVGERHCVAFALRCLGEVTSAANDAAAQDYLSESLRLYGELGDVQGLAYVELLFGRLDYLNGRYGSAPRHYQASVRLFKIANWPDMVAQCLDGLAMVAGARGQAARAVQLAAASTGLSELIAQPAYPIERAEVDRALAPARQTLRETGVLVSLPAQAMTVDEAVAYALADVGAATEAT